MAERVMRSAQPEEQEIERAGGGRWLLVRCVPFRNEVGRAQGVVLTLVDLTDRHLAERREVAQAAIMQGALEAMEAAVAVIDRHGRVIHLNQKWREAADAGEAQSILPPLELGADFFAADGPASTGQIATLCREGLRKVQRGELPQFLHDYAVDSAGKRHWFRLHAVPLRSPEPGFAIAHFNITPTQNAGLVAPAEPRPA